MRFAWKGLSVIRLWRRETRRFFVARSRAVNQWGAARLVVASSPAGRLYLSTLPLDSYAVQLHCTARVGGCVLWVGVS